MRRIPAKILSPFLKRFVKVYFKKPRRYNYLGIQGTILPTVFFPHFTQSTRILMDVMNEKKLQGKTLLELGCGTGLISTLCAKNGGIVTASDINPKAVENAELNAKNNSVKINTIQSDLFDAIPAQKFDFILINPPYYPKKPANMAENAWFCGEDFAYFKKLFLQLGNFIDDQSTVLMILSEDCAFDKIQQLGQKKGFGFEVVLRQRKKGEDYFVYGVKRSS
jgi:release factor glutamine methyltransferase